MSDRCSNREWRLALRRCSQVLLEFGNDIVVLIANVDGDVVLATTLRELMPHSFGLEDLG